MVTDNVGYSNLQMGQQYITLYGKKDQMNKTIADLASTGFSVLLDYATRAWEWYASSIFGILLDATLTSFMDIPAIEDAYTIRADSHSTMRYTYVKPVSSEDFVHGNTANRVNISELHTLCYVDYSNNNNTTKWTNTTRIQYIDRRFYLSDIDAIAAYQKVNNPEYLTPSATEIACEYVGKEKLTELEHKFYMYPFQLMYPIW